MNNGLKYYHFEKWARKHMGQDFDVLSEFDSTLTLEENKTQFSGKFISPPMEIEPEFVEAMMKKQIDQQISVQKKNLVYAHIEDYFKEVYQAVEKLKMNLKLNLILVKSRAGLGKTTAIYNALDKHNMEYIIANNITHAYIYRCLYENNDKVVWLKDCARIFTTKDSLETLKAATETEPEMRILTRLNYSKDQKDLPKEFLFTGKIIFDYNSMENLKYSEDFEALVSRGDYIELSFSQEQITDIMMKIAKEKWQKNVTKFIVGNFDFTNRFNLRHQQKAFVDYIYAKEKGFNWKDYIKERMEKDKSPIRNLVYQLIGDDIVKKSYLAKSLLRNRVVNTSRTAYRRIEEWVELDEIFEMQGQISMNPLTTVNPR